MSKLIKVGTITQKQILIMERATRRTNDIEQGNTNFKHKVHKSKKDYNRKNFKNSKLW